MDYSLIDNTHPSGYFKDKYEAHFDQGQGIPKIDDSGMSVQDIARTPFLFLQDHHRDYKSIVETTLKGVQSPNEMNKLFFSEDNIRRIQKKIKLAVATKTKNKFRLDVDQNVDDLILVMRSVYMEYGRYLPNNIVRQVKQLNDQVVKTVLPDIITNIKQYYGYLRDINSPLKPMDRPVNINNAGRKTLPSVTSTWNA